MIEEELSGNTVIKKCTPNMCGTPRDPAPEQTSRPGPIIKTIFQEKVKLSDLERCHNQLIALDRLKYYNVTTVLVDLVGLCWLKTKFSCLNMLVQVDVGLGSEFYFVPIALINCNIIIHYE